MVGGLCAAAGGEKDKWCFGASGQMQLPGSAPVGSLAARLALHSLVFQSARAVALLWVRCASAPCHTWPLHAEQQ